MSAQSPMPPSARRAGLDALGAVLRRHNPGLAVVFELEADDRVHNPATRQINGTLAAPQDTDAPGDRIDVAATPPRAADHHTVQEAGEDLPAIIDGKAT